MTTLWHVAINYQSVLSDGFDFIIILLRTYDTTPFEWLGQKLYCPIGYETDDVHNIAFLNNVIHLVLIIHKSFRNMQCDVTVYRLLNGLLRQDNTNSIQQKMYQKTIWNWRICKFISFWITSVSSLIFLRNLIRIFLDWKECHWSLNKWKVVSYLVYSCSRVNIHAFEIFNLIN